MLAVCLLAGDVRRRAPPRATGELCYVCDMRSLPLLVLGASLATIVGCNPGPKTPKAAARAFLEASVRGDEEAARKLVVGAPGAPQELIDLTLHTRFARTRAKSRVAEVAARRFGPAAAEAFPVAWNVNEELRALESAPVEGDREKAVIQAGKKPLVARQVGMAWWKTWKIEIDPAQSEQEQRRMKAHAAAAEAAADATIRGIERGEYADARAAAAAFLQLRLQQLQQNP